MAEMMDRLRSGLVRTAKQSVEIVCLSAILTSSTIELSSASDDPKKTSDEERIDRKLLAYLTNRKMINWCGNTCKLAPLTNDQTSGGGLLRAVASSIWGLQEEATDSFLQRLLHVALTSGKQKSAFKERWELEQEMANFSPARQSHSKYAWEEVCRAFQGSEMRIEKEDILLDPIHIFSLSNVLRRPILVLGDVSSTFNQPPITDLTGIYLPLLSSPESCVPYPLLFVRHEGLFRALVVNRVPLEWWQMQLFRSVPLVRVDKEPFHIRCLLASENRRIRELLLTYLKIAEISYTTPDGTFQVLTSRLSTERPLLGSPIGEDVFAVAAPGQVKHSPGSFLAPDEVPSSGEDEGPAPTDASSKEGGCVRNCVACQAIRRTEMKKLTNCRPSSESEAKSARRTELTSCENIRCRNKGSPKYGGRCYACYVMLDQSMEVFDEDEKIGYLKAMNRKEDQICRKVEQMQDVMVEDVVNESRKAKARDDALVDKDKVVVAVVKETKRSVKDEDKHKSAKAKHRHGYDNVKDKQKYEDVKDKQESEKVKNKQESEKVKDKQESEDVKDKQESAKVKDTDDAKKVTDSTRDKDVRASPKANDISKANKLHESETVTRTADESVAVSDTRQPIKEPAAPSKVSSTMCNVDQTDDVSAATATARLPPTEHPTGETSDLRFRSKGRQSIDRKCIVDFCNNAADDTYRGLCRPCYQTLVLHRSRRNKEEDTALPASSTAVPGGRCLMEGCKEPVTNTQLGLCLSCLRTQIFAARDLERRKELRRSLLKPSENPNQKANADPENIGSSDERCSGSPKRRIPKSPSDANGAKELNPTPQRSRTSLLHYSPQRTQAKRCLTPDCDRYGDPSYDGYCSLCFGKHTLVPRN